MVSVRGLTFFLFFDFCCWHKFCQNFCQSFGWFLYKIRSWLGLIPSDVCINFNINFSVENRDGARNFSFFLIFFRSRIPIEWTSAMQFLKEKNLMSSLVFHLNSNSILYVQLYTVDKEPLNTIMICYLKDTQSRARH